MKKTALVTGAGGGLGKAVTRMLLESGYQVVAVDLKIGGLEDLKNGGLGDLGIGGFGDSLTLIEADITDTEGINEVIYGLGLEEKGLDVFVSLAGIYDMFPVTEGHYDKFNRIMSVNFLATANLITRLFRPLVKSQGRVVVVTSESYKIQAMFQPYMISKAALESYCHTAWQELSLVGVKLSVVRPGAINTPLLDWMKMKGIDDPDSMFRDAFNRSLEQSRKMVGTITPPEKVAEKVMKAVKARKPRQVYQVNNNPILSLITILPLTIIDRLIVNRFKNK